MKLYSFFRSGTSHRTRIALNLKGLDYEISYVSLAKNEHQQLDFKRLNPQGFVPVLETESGLLLQSPAIIEWIEQQYPEPALLPADALGKEKVRAIAALIGCDIHPLNNKRVLEHLRQLGLDQNQINAWCAKWIQDGFSALEQILAQDPTRKKFCYGNQPSLADAYLIPQVVSAQRFQVDLSAYPQINEIYQHCMTLEAFQKAAPEQQADAF
ncbi:maleylacetoacetate isomerase [Acinetobacter sp. CIP 64.2]|uniref:Maleylacetoacetate isomerase n=2 Tax=Acinetobacter TaxID=469 RepID=S3T1I3_9GAMM|nr:MULTISPECIES: maleylacetoacetate isomerase [Acinetobacter]ENX16263.1 maleylacetoacetate isomerase [Acinetobacter sp. CIP 64.2]EPG35336.1 maleylacetoacetate isomerase [Acinetobacter colistiniresistens]MDO3656381.1 maleylacetoacetate isomerase [Acinetobacter genomosp. 15BJ]UUM28072.1 maleylacetoacetate isomerase [Acinetobacter colistiniresistens]